MSAAFYALPTDDVAQLATVTASAADPDYPASKLITENAADPAKLTAPTGYFDLDLITARAVVWAALIYHDLDAALSGVTLTMGASLGASTFSQAFTIPAHHEDGWPVSPYAVFPSTQTYRYARLTITNANSLNPSIGRLLLLTAQRTLPWARPGATEDEEHNDKEMETEAGVQTIYSVGGKRRLLKGELPLTAANTAALLSLRRSAQGRLYSFPFVPDDTVNDVYYGKFDENKLQRTFQSPRLQTASFVFKESARGVPFP